MACGAGADLLVDLSETVEGKLAKEMACWLLSYNKD